MPCALSARVRCATHSHGTGHPAVTAQLEGYGAPRPTPTSHEEPLIAERMRTYPDLHPSVPSVKQQVAMGCPALVYDQLGSDQWVTTKQWTIDQRQRTLSRSETKMSGLAGREGKKSVTALLVSDALVMPRETLVLPEPLAKRPLQTGARDLAVAKHLSTLAASGKW